MPEDLRWIRELREELNIYFPAIPFDTIEKEFKNGYALNHYNEVIGLNLNGVEISGDTEEFISHLTNLEKLSLMDTHLEDLQFLESLEVLNTLILSQNQLTDISSLAKLKALTYLNLSGNQLADVSALQHLVQLTYLDLRYNEITDVSLLLPLTNLTFLDLRYNRLRELPEAITALGMEINYRGETGISLQDNPLEKPPIEIVKKGKEAVRIYFESLRTGINLPLNEVKVLLVGDGGAGKTSLVRHLMNEPFDPNEPQTHGIAINHRKIKADDKEIKVRLWDFGGQEIMHATHQFFLSKRSLYILVLDSRKDEKTEYWLKHIESLGGNSPVLVVINKIDQNPSFDVNRKFLAEKYSNIKSFYRISCSTSKGIDTFKVGLEEALSQMEMLKTTWPKGWFNMKIRLEEMDEHFISYTQYIKMCELENINDPESQNRLVDFLNDLGVVLHFRDFELEDTNVLEPRWVTEAVYRIINSSHLERAKGFLDLNKLDKILNPQEGGRYYFPRDRFKYIIDLMKKFELCYQVDREKVLVPDLLDVEESRFDFDYGSALRFIVEYDFLPGSIMPRFMVRRNMDVKSGLHWRTGVVLEDSALRSTAVIKEDALDKKIYIYVIGDQRREYFSVIRKTLRDINNSFVKLTVTEWVPLPGYEDVKVEYNELLGHELAGREEIFIGKLRKSFNVDQLLDGIASEVDRKQESERIARKEGNIYLNVFQANQQTQVVGQTVSQNTNVAVDIDLNIDLKTELPIFQRDFSALKEILGSADPTLKEELNRIEDSLDEVTAGSEKKELKNPMNKLHRFLEKLGDEDSNFSKILRGTKKGIELAQKVGKTYNKFAQWLALPQVPDIILGTKGKK